MNEAFIPDLDMAAYVKMRGYQVSRVGSDGVYFSTQGQSGIDTINALKIEYINSEFIEFDSLVMTLKKLPITSTKGNIDPTIQMVDSLGQAAYLKKNKWRIEGRLGPNRFVFHVPVDDKDKFQSLQFQWANSELRDFDAALMALKQLRLKRTRSRSDHKR